MEPCEPGSLQYWDQLLMLLIQVIEEDKDTYAQYLNQCVHAP